MKLFASATSKQALLLSGLLLVRFGYELIGHIAFVILTYALAYLFFRTIAKDDRPLYLFTWPKKKIVIIGFLIAVLCLAWGIFGHYFNGNPLQVPSNPLIWLLMFPPFLLSAIVVQFALNALPEELLFRGFLWGYLKNNIKISNFSILLIQAILFWAGHYWYFDLPWRWINVLVSGLVFGIVAWKTKSLFISSIAHACLNSSSVFFNSISN
ncbi:MAG: CPBP family intramembrane metalloprotease [Holophagaceae bacterium]|nr:CPBP family intramembrane metalloprotease [Holophagaceae bacterium]